MDFKFRSMEERSSNYFTPSPIFPLSNISFFTQQAIRAGFSSPDSTRREFHRNSNLNPNDFRESIQRELEKERIRAEIIAEEVFRRRILEDEVRREMMLERELAFRRGDRDLGFGSPTRFEPRVPLLTNFEHPIGVSPHREVGFRRPETLPFRRDPVVAGNVDGNGIGIGNGSGFSSGVSLKEIKQLKGPASEVNSDKVILLAKPNSTDLKRKATGSLSGALVDQSAGSKKPKTKEEWSCALCRVTATSERALNDHLQGKRHKARESRLNTQRVGFGTSPLPKTGKPIKVPGASDNLSSKKKAEKAGGETSLGKAHVAPAQDLPGTANKIALLQGTDTSVKKENVQAARPQKKSSGVKRKKKFKFLCETCQVGACSLKVMNAHKNGKRHLAKVMELYNIDKAASGKKPAQKGAVEEKKDDKEPDVAAAVEKGMVEEKKELHFAATKETINEMPAQVSTVEEKKDCKEQDMVASMEKGVVEEKKEPYIAAANDVRKRYRGKTSRNQEESADYHLAGVEDKPKLIGIVSDDLAVSVM